MADEIMYWNKVSHQYHRLEENLKNTMTHHLDEFFKETGLKVGSFVITKTKSGKIVFMEDIMLQAPGDLEVALGKAKI